MVCQQLKYNETSRDLGDQFEWRHLENMNGAKTPP